MLTPRYFRSPECRRELQFFARQSTRLGVKELVLPLLYVDVPSIHDDAASDDLIKLVRSFQWQDWRELRFMEPTSAEYRRAVSKLAERLVQANEKSELSESISNHASGMDQTDDSPGMLDKLAAGERALPKLVETIQFIGEDIVTIGGLVQESVRHFQKASEQGRGFDSRITLARSLARDLAGPAENIRSRGNDFSTQIHELDTSLRLIVDVVSKHALDHPDSRDEVCSFFAHIRNLSITARQGLDSFQGMVDSIQPIENMSRDLRPVLRRLRDGLTVMIEAREVTDEWLQLIDKSDLDCSSASKL